MNLLERTRRLLQGLSPPAPPRVQYYRVACPDGHWLRGERTEGYQALRCPICGEGIFVLPRSPLPEPVSTEPARSPRAPLRPEPSGRDEESIPLTDPVFSQQLDTEHDADGEIEWLDAADAAGETTAPDPLDPAAIAPVKGPVGGTVPAERARPRAHPRPPAGAKPKPSPTPSRPRRRGAQPGTTTASAAEPAVVVLRRERLVAWAGRHRNPLVFSTVVLVVLGTVGYRVWRSRFEDLPRIVENGRAQGLAALDAGKFDTAHQLLSEASRAVDSLGDAVEGAAEIRQGAKEAALFTSLVPESLESILADASPDPKEWAARFNTFYKGRSIIIDARIAEVPDASGAGHYDLDYRVLPPGEGVKRPRIGRIDLDGFQLFEQLPRKEGDRVVFGARLASVALVNEEWLIGLLPDSGVLMMHPKALESLGWPNPDDLPAEDQP